MPTEYFLAVRAIVNGEDPVGLLELDAPEDEYDDEVHALISQATPLSPSAVIEVFVRWFGNDGRPPDDMAQRIATGINEARIHYEAPPKPPPCPAARRRDCSDAGEHAQPGSDYPTLCGIPAEQVDTYRHLFYGHRPTDCPICSELVWNVERPLR